MGKKKIRNVKTNEEKGTDNIMIIDTGGGLSPTITKTAWKILSRTERKIQFLGYQDQGKPKTCPVVNAVTKAYPKDYQKPIILLHNNATLIDDDNEKESLCVPFACMAHGIKIDMVPNKYGGKGGMTVDGDFIPFDFDDEKLFIKIQKPT